MHLTIKNFRFIKKKVLSMIIHLSSLLAFQHNMQIFLKHIRFNYILDCMKNNEIIINYLLLQ